MAGCGESSQAAWYRRSLGIKMKLGGGGGGGFDDRIFLEHVDQAR
jgi:hypothetical protein